VAIEPELPPSEPPHVLFHGTPERSLAQILQTGLLPMQRRFVHLSRDADEALVVARRRKGPPVILVVEAARLAADGTPFHESTSGIWLVARVPLAYLRVLEER
jgi:putative RNA 2'-phosphotransferase